MEEKMVLGFLLEKKRIMGFSLWAWTKPMKSVWGKGIGLGSVYHLGHLLLTLWPVAEGWVERIRMSEPRGNKDAYGWPTTWWGQVIITVTSRHVLPTFPTFGSAFGVLGQNGPFVKLNVQNGHILKLLFKMASLMPRRCHIIKKYFFFVIIVKAAVGKRGFIFALKPQLANAASFLH